VAEREDSRGLGSGGPADAAGPRPLSVRSLSDGVKPAGERAADREPAPALPCRRMDPRSAPGDLATPRGPALFRGGTRAVVAAGGLAIVWGLAFATRLLPFFPTIVAGGVLTGLAGWWVRRSERGWHAGEPGRRTFPPLRVTPAQAAFAVTVGVIHLAVGHLLFAAGGRLLPELTATASAVYTRAASLPLVAAILLGGVVTASLEELFWRGAVQPLTTSALRHRWPRLAALPGGTIVGIALPYALFHVATGQLALVAAALLGGLVWGWLLERTGSVGATMLAHATWTSLMLAFPPV
jgi:membrane protease YdiL (CAAX protease family)